MGSYHDQKPRLAHSAKQCLLLLLRGGSPKGKLAVKNPQCLRKPTLRERGINLNRIEEEINELKIWLWDSPRTQCVNREMKGMKKKLRVLEGISINQEFQHPNKRWNIHHD